MKEDTHILATFDLSEEAREKIRQAAAHINLTVIPAKKAEDIPDDRWAQTEILFTQGVLPDPDKAPRIRWIQFNSSGVDPYLDHGFFKKANV